MYLKELTINGFKSFADATSLKLSRGITSIVGPNGCGKSNIADAIRWVLGEQSAKSLRAGNMPDVIFQGTQTRKSVNLCQVSLLFSDCEAALGTSFNEVEIIRKVLQDGSSNYSINGKNCRLKDIQNLFMDTGVGRVSYSFMVQGQIDQILSSNPFERRALFEEAAGITRYKNQRREALNKLTLVDTNLNRINDVIEEVSRQTSSLKRQASKAIRYKAFTKRLHHLDLALNAYRYSKISANLENLKAETQQLEKNVLESETEIQEKEKKIAQQRQNHHQLHQEQQEVQKSVYDLRSKKEQAQSQSEILSNRIKDNDQRLKNIDSELFELNQKKENLGQQSLGDTQNRHQQVELVNRSEALFDQKNKELISAREKFIHAEAKQKEYRQAITHFEEKLKKLNAQSNHCAIELKSSQVKQEHQNSEILHLEKEISRQQKEWEHIEKTLQEKNAQTTQAKNAFEACEKTVKQQNEAHRDLQRSIQECDRTLAQQTAQILLLKELQEKLEGFNEGAKALLGHSFDDILSNQSCRLLINEMQVNPSYTLALETLLGQARDAIILDDKDKIPSIIDRLDEKKWGRVCIQTAISSGPSNQKKLSPSTLPQWLKPVAECISLENNSNRDSLHILFASCYFCESFKDFIDYWETHPDFDFLFVATQKGELIDRRGFIYGGHSKKGNDSYLQRKQNIKQQQGIQAETKQKLKVLQEQASQLQQKLAASEQELETQRQRINALTQEASILRSQKKSLDEQISKNQEWLLRAQKVLEKLVKDHSSIQEELDQSQKQLTQSETELTQQRNSLAQSEKEVEQLGKDHESKKELLLEVRLEHNEIKQKLEFIDRELQATERKAQDIEQTRLKYTKEAEKSIAQKKQLEEEITQLKNREQDIHQQFESAKTILLEKSQSLSELQTTITQMEEAFAQQRASLAELQKKRHKSEIHLAKEQSQTDFIIQKVDREYHQDLTTIIWQKEFIQAGNPFPDTIKVDLDEKDKLEDFFIESPVPNEETYKNIEEPDWNAIDEEVKSLHTRINSIGPVNLGAIEEYTTLKERHEFLKTQSDDLWQSKEKLLKVIDTINETSAEKFKENFEQVRKNFSYTFASLFGGGESDLILADAENILESGIDIIARPPGTKLRSLVLLSGGQKTMTALALLFAIYMVKPSPFCVLDELDAPLDDANVGRFTKIVQQFTKHSQFIVITHNKRTIAAADAIYGVTMEEKGVSKVISAHFNKDSKEPTKTLSNSSVQ